jgi:L-lactate dehydrogenase complex protein LldF
MANGKIKNWVVNSLVKGWKQHRGEMEFPRKSFNEMWKDRDVKSE